VFQCAAVVASLLALNHAAASGEETSPLPPWLLWSLVVSVWLAVVSTVYSGIGYVIAAAKYLLPARTE
jgi:phosphatidylglycerophosphate synthase